MFVIVLCCMYWLIEYKAISCHPSIILFVTDPWVRINKWIIVVRSQRGKDAHCATKTGRGTVVERRCWTVGPLSSRRRWTRSCWDRPSLREPLPSSPPLQSLQEPSRAPPPQLATFSATGAAVWPRSGSRSFTIRNAIPSNLDNALM